MSYLRKQLSEYKDFLIQVENFISCMLDDINKVKSELGVIKELKLVFNEVFSSTFCEKIHM